MAYIVILLIILLYMDFFRTSHPEYYTRMNKISYVLIGSVTFVSTWFINITLMWMILGALINPEKLMPIAVMLSSTFLVGRSIASQLSVLQQVVKERIDFIIEFLIEALIDEFISSRPDLASAARAAFKSQLDEGKKQNQRDEDLDEGKVQFINALCDRGREIASDSAGRDGDVDDIQEDEDEDVEEKEEGEVGEFKFSSDVRRKIDLCFNYIIRKAPLPKGVQQSLRDPKKLAEMCMQKRDIALNKMVGRHGLALLKEIVVRNLETCIDHALVQVLEPHEDSQINVLNAEALEEASMLFYDKELAEQILSEVHCKLDGYREKLIEKAREVFAAYDPANTNKTEDDEKIKRKMDINTKQFKEQFLDQAGIGSQTELGVVDMTGDGMGECGIVPFLQTIEVLPPTRVLLKKSTDTGHAKKIAIKILDSQIQGLIVVLKAVTKGATVLHQHDISLVLQRLTDNHNDGRVDRLWWSAFHSICQDLYIYHPSEARYPCTDRHLEAAWAQETQGDENLLMEVDRIEDIILSDLMTAGGDRKLWPEAFVLLSRHLHVWPEIPMDDAVVRVLPGSSCEVLSKVPEVEPPEYDSFGRERKALESESKEDVEMHTPTVMKTPPFKDSKLVIRDFGDFSPDHGFAMLQFPEADLLKMTSEDWVTLDWDEDAKANTAAPPFPGPLDVYLVFLNLCPLKKYTRTTGSSEDQWEKVDGMKPPTVMEDPHSLQRGSSSMSAMSGFSRSVWDDADMRNEYLGGSNQNDLYYGFGEPEWKTKLPASQKDTRPYVEIRRKTFPKKSTITLKGMHSHEPIFVFIKVQRTSIPDANSFQDAHEAPFLDSHFFKKSWNYFVTRSQQHCSSSDILHGTINVQSDGPDLISELMLKRYELKDDAARDHVTSPRGEHENMTFLVPEQRNPALYILQAEKLQPALKYRDTKTGNIKPYWIRSLKYDFYVEDRLFVEFDTCKHKQYCFRGTKLRNSTASQMEIKSIALLENGRIVCEFKCSTGGGLDSSGETAGCTAEYKQVGNSQTKDIVITFEEETKIDQLDFVTLGGDSDPNQWEILGSDDGRSWNQLCERTTPFPLDKLSRKILNDEAEERESGELVSIGKRQSGAVWYRDGKTWFRMRGLWFDAFVELLEAFDLKMDRSAAWSIWRNILSFKYKPVSVQNPPGFITVADAKRALLELMELESFVSDKTFRVFNVESRLDLQDTLATKLYEKICISTPNYRGAENLVSWKDFSRELKKTIGASRPYLESKQQGGKQYVVGCLWFEPLYQVVISSMPEMPDREEVHEHFLSYASLKTGLLPMDRTYDIISKLGRPGLKFGQYRGFIKRLGMHISDTTLHITFNQIDINQNHTLDSKEVQNGMNLLMRAVLPDQVLRLAKLHTEQIVLHVMSVILILAVIFLFLKLAFSSLFNDKGAGVESAIQSIVAGLAAAGVNKEQQRSDPKQFKEFVSKQLEQILGAASRFAYYKEERRKQD
eukprot:gnl/MRDRNA2_/MRDRNA2_74795_c0_seq1.p1 gnl/MRDRNA2_/MRDRNA2_74795_c0~~gnl/MRDRNA2_/MRDRNA2_74795_c0_seq1.p1  ORF type:complete len:1594 (-),score=306.70 gnl/MRDRNA2_/MRDRNA2_74795_c0_seq1:195-4613(-)